MPRRNSNFIHRVIETPLLALPALPKVRGQEKEMSNQRGGDMEKARAGKHVGADAKDGVRWELKNSFGFTVKEMSQWP
jgi:hypothetical protein